MGCNCKNKKNSPQVEKPVEEIKVAEKTAIDVIQQMEIHLSEFNVNADSRQKLSEFVQVAFGEIMGNYCDVPCRTRIQKRLDELKKGI